MAQRVRFEGRPNLLTQGPVAESAPGPSRASSRGGRRASGAPARRLRAPESRVGFGVAGATLIKAFQQQQEFIADASHELRTPLTVLRSATDLMNTHREQPLEENGELFDDVRAEIARMERLAQDLLTLARSVPALPVMAVPKSPVALSISMAFRVLVPNRAV